MGKRRRAVFYASCFSLGPATLSKARLRPSSVISDGGQHRPLADGHALFKTVHAVRRLCFKPSSEAADSTLRAAPWCLLRAVSSMLRPHYESTSQAAFNTLCSPLEPRHKLYLGLLAPTTHARASDLEAEHLCQNRDTPSVRQGM
jgi:hypothetical protein